MLRRAAVAVAASLALIAPADAATLPAGFDDTQVATVPQPTALAFTPDGRLLVTSKPGRLRVVRNGTLLATPAIDLSARVCAQSERGLLGVAADPDFQVNRHVYLYYTFNKYDTCALAAPPNGPVNRVSRFTLRDDNTIDPASELVLIDGIPSPGGNHNGGHLVFGKDNHLYVTVGDGGCDYANNSGCGIANNASRDRNVLVGKVLRITAAGGIPADNPFRGANSARCNETGRTGAGSICQETYAWGLRNPFRLGFDENAAGARFFINDVGQNAWEEIDEGKAGADYGWNVREGHCAANSTTNCGAPPAGMTNPLFDYGRGAGCTAITGGAFVPNGLWPSGYNGRYLFGDYSCGRIQSLRLTVLGWAAADFGTNMGSVVDMVFGPWGSSRALYYVTFGGQLRRTAYTGNRSPVAVAKATPTSGGTPLGVFFDGSESSDPDGGALTYSWDFGDGSAPVTVAEPGYVYQQTGTYQATLRVTDATGATDTDTVRIDVGNTAPQPAIESPDPDLRFAVGDRIALVGSATDPEDGALTPFSMEWTVLLHHNAHTHPFLGPQSGNNIAFDAPAPEDLTAAGSSYLEVRLTAIDSKGLRETISQDLRPNTVGLFFDTDPDGLPLTVDGIEVTDPAAFVSWEGYRFTVQAPSIAGLDGKAWTFGSWSDGGAARHTITTPAATTTYTAAFNEAQCGGGVGVGMLLVMAGAAIGRRRRRARLTGSSGR
jgi:glucose/arabinose dehydrogenase/PKD repeat protein